jgi:hypothetical protein
MANTTLATVLGYCSDGHGNNHPIYNLSELHDAARGLDTVKLKDTTVFDVHKLEGRGGKDWTLHGNDHDGRPVKVDLFALQMPAPATTTNPRGNSTSPKSSENPFAGHNVETLMQAFSPKVLLKLLQSAQPETIDDLLRAADQATIDELTEPMKPSKSRKPGKAQANSQPKAGPGTISIKDLVELYQGDVVEPFYENATKLFGMATAKIAERLAAIRAKKEARLQHPEYDPQFRMK